MGSFDSKVSAEFSNFAMRNANEIEEVKHQENAIRGIPLPVGWSGPVLITDMQFSTSKASTNPDGSAKGGIPQCAMTLQVLAEGPHKNTKLYKNWYFSAKGDYTAAEKLGWFLGDLLRMGLPKELKEGFKSPVELVEFFLNQPYQLMASVKETNNKSFNEGKEIVLAKEGMVVDSSSSVVPGGAAPTKPNIQVNDEVLYVEQKHKVLSIHADGSLTIQSMSTGRQRQVNPNDIG